MSDARRTQMPPRGVRGASGRRGTSGGGVGGVLERTVLLQAPVGVARGRRQPQRAARNALPCASKGLGGRVDGRLRQLLRPSARGGLGGRVDGRLQGVLHPSAHEGLGGIGNGGMQEVLRPSAREGLGGGGPTEGCRMCSALAPVRASGEGAIGRLWEMLRPRMLRC